MTDTPISDDPTQPRVIVCANASDTRIVVPGSIRQTADCCGAMVWLSPPGKRLMTEYLETKLMCLNCSIVVHDVMGQMGENPEIVELPGSAEYLGQVTGMSTQEARQFGAAMLKRLLQGGGRP